MARIKFQLEWPKPCPIWVLPLIGGVFLCVGAGFGIRGALCVQGASLSEGTVIAIGPKEQFVHPSTTGGDREGSVDVAHPQSENQHYQKKRSSSTVPEVQYSVNGTVHTIHGVISTSFSVYKIGQNVPVYYFPERPAEGVVGSFVELWMLPVIFGGVGFLLALAGAFQVLWRLTNPISGN